MGSMRKKSNDGDIRSHEAMPSIHHPPTRSPIHPPNNPSLIQAGDPLWLEQPEAARQSRVRRPEKAHENPRSLPLPIGGPRHLLFHRRRPRVVQGPRQVAATLYTAEWAMMCLGEPHGTCFTYSPNAIERLGLFHNTR